MQDKLKLLHEYLTAITKVSSEEELDRLAEGYNNRFEENRGEVIYQLVQDAQMLGREILLLKANGADAARSRKLAALTPEERNELAEVERIIDQNLFGYHFQPIVSTVDGSIYSYEALMRPKSEMGLVPFHILKYAVLTGRLTDIERATFLNVMNIVDNNKDKIKDRKVFINSIPKTKLSNEDYKRLSELFINNSDTVVVELTEGAELDEAELDNMQDRLHNMDIKIAIDDYGTGYSNVHNLLRYNPDYVKIDRALLTGIQDNPKKRHFVREIIEFCHANGIIALAEGIETSEELRAVILMGADLIQGFYTARPSAEIVDSIPYDIRQEIKVYQQERQDGRNQQVYVAEAGERVLLDKLVMAGYTCVLVGKDNVEGAEITVVGSPSLDTDIGIRIDRTFKGVITLENAHLSNLKNRPCIELGEISDVTLRILGENKLDKGGIRVPEGAKLTLEGDGKIEINTEAPEYYGIGNEISAAHGEIAFRHSGIVAINAKGKTGVCIGSGRGGSISLGQGMYVLNISGRNGVAIGSLHSDCKVDVSNCSLDANISLMYGTAIGSMTGSADVHVWSSSTKLFMMGEELSALGTLNGENAKVLINDAHVIINTRGARCTCVGSLDKNTDFRVEKASFRAAVGGEKSLPFGGISGETKVTFVHADITAQMDTNVDVEKYITAENVDITGGRVSFSNYGRELDLKIPNQEPNP